MVFNFRTPSFSDHWEAAEDTEVLREFSLKEVKAAIQKFSKENLLAPVGRFGYVYKGQLQDGSLIAIKTFYKVFQTVSGKIVHQCFEREFERELEVGRLKLGHPNILRLKGYCITKNNHLLVYPWMVNNNLSSWLRPTQMEEFHPLDWTTRKRIALEVSRGLDYLHHHCAPKIIHCGITPANILLNEDFEAIIAGFSAAVVMHDEDSIRGTFQRHIPCNTDVENDDPNLSTLPRRYRSHHHYEDTYVKTESLHGTHGYIGPEYFYEGKYTLKKDVFAFGITLHDLITDYCHRGAVWHRDDNLSYRLGGFMPDSIKQVMDPNLQGCYVAEEAKQMVELASRCTHPDPRERPLMSEVVRELEVLAETPKFKISNSLAVATLSRSESDSTLFYSFSSSVTASEASSEY